MDNTYYLFSSRLRKAMKEKGVTQTKLCNVTGINKAAMSSYLSGRYKPKMDRLVKIANALNVHEAWLAGMVDEDNYLVKNNIHVNNNDVTSTAEYDFYDEDVPPNSNDLSMAVSFEEQGLLNLFRCLTKTQQGIIFDLLNDFVSKN